MALLRHQGSSVQFEADGSQVKALALLVLPIIMIIMMKKGWDLVSTLIVCDILGIVLNLVLGTIPLAAMLSNDGPIVGGLSGMMSMLLYCMLLFQILEILNASGAFEAMMKGLMKHTKTARSGELICMLGTAIGTAAAGGSSPAVMFFGPMVRQVTKKFKIDRNRGANILDATACGISGLLPYGTGCMLSVNFALACEGVDPSFSFMQIIPYCFHCIFLLILFLLSVLTGVGRKYEKEEA